MGGARFRPWMEEEEEEEKVAFYLILASRERSSSSNFSSAARDLMSPSRPRIYGTRAEIKFVSSTWHKARTFLLPSFPTLAADK